jgi:peroxiredoxin
MQSRHWLPIVAILAALSLACAQESAPDEVAALLQDYQQQERAYQDAARQAGVKADLRQHPAREYLPRFKELAEKYAGQAAALPALTWILDQAARPTIADPKADTRWVVERLTRDHAGQPEIAATLEKVLHTAWRLEPEQVHALYDAVLAQNPDHGVLAQATFQKAVYLAHYSEKQDDPKPVRQQALQLLREVKKTYKDTEFAKQADGWIFDLQKLQVGMKAPELVGVDLDGKAVKLSAYAGHVVVIDFWASNGVCRDALPREQALLSMFGDRSFAIIGINCDYSRKSLESTLHESQITWPTIYDGRNGVLAREWNVQGTPTRYVLDHHGIIRYRGNDVTRLEETVRDLIKKLPPSKDRKARKS